MKIVNFSKDHDTNFQFNPQYAKVEYSDYECVYKKV